MTSLKKFVKMYMPDGVVKYLQVAHSRWVEQEVNNFDSKLFRKHRLHKLKNATVEQLDAKLFFHAHSVEKGLSHENMRPYFGKAALTSLSQTMKEYREQNFDMNRASYINALSTIQEYILRHEEIDKAPSNLYSIFDADTIEQAINCGEKVAGTHTVSLDSKANNSTKNFKELFQGRVSVREFADGTISQNRLLPAVQLAAKSPSVCNRQSARLKIITDPDMIDRILVIQGGFSGFKTPPALVVVTSDLATFLGPTERNQAFVDGGLYSMSLLMAFEYYSLAACPLNAMMKSAQEESVKSILNIPERERIIMFIAVGEFKSEVLAPKSFRAPVSEIVSHISTSES